MLQGNFENFPILEKYYFGLFIQTQFGIIIRNLKCAKHKIVKTDILKPANGLEALEDAHAEEKPVSIYTLNEKKKLIQTWKTLRNLNARDENIHGITKAMLWNI